MLLVVRCPACRGASRVEEPALGSMVQCPRCQGTFTAIEEAELIAPGSASACRNPTPPTPAPSTPASASPRLRRRLESLLTPPVLAPEAPKPPAAEPDFDPHREPQGALPASVLIGLALLPFAIPICWLIVPAVTGQPPMLSIATPLALAVSVSILCLAVIYTVDWTPATRVKGVLTLVGLSYFAGVSLYFLDKETVNRVRKFFGGDQDGVIFRPPGADYEVKLPHPPNSVPDKPLGLASLACYHAIHQGLFGQRYIFVVGSGAPGQGNANDPAPGTDDWFDKATDDIVDRATGQLIKSWTVKQQDVFPGRELEIKLAGGWVRVVRIFVIKNKVYYLSVEGPGIAHGDDFTTNFFDSFFVRDAR